MSLDILFSSIHYRFMNIKALVGVGVNDFGFVLMVMSYHSFQWMKVR